MYLKRIRLTNWGPYRGSHTLDLEPTVYAVQASHADDPERSNWVGKSWFLGAIRFLLTGEKPATCKHEDDWITWGEKSGSVLGELSDGTLIERKRALGKGTQTTVQILGGEEARQDRAQEVLYDLLGMNARDLMATSFLEQKKIARLIEEDPAERTDIVSGWLELGVLDAAQAWLQASFSKLLREERELPPAKDLPDDASFVQLEDGAGEALMAYDAAETKVETIEAQLATLAEHTKHAQREDRFRVYEARGLQARKELDALKAQHPFNTAGGLPGAAHMMNAHVDAAMLARGVAAERLQQLREVSAGEWDGTCPKTCEACPAQDHVRKVASANERNVINAEIELDTLVASFEEKKAKLEEVQRKGRLHDQLEAELKRLRTECMELFDSVDYIEAHGAAPDQQKVLAELAQARIDRDQLKGEKEKLEAELAAIERAAQDAEATKFKRAELNDQLATHREAIDSVKGAHREIAEGALEAMQRGANELLQAAGIDLVVEVSWARDGKKLATHCDTCGTAFPKSQAVKVCATCNAARGPHQVEKLQILPNDRSGAADDIAGLAFQLAASSWLRVKRAAPWAVACIDEPFGSLDKANSKALSNHLHAMIRGSYAFEQGFVVAHDPSIMEALPARVQIMGGAEGSKLEVL